jgi:hypothetical protein
MAAHMSEGRAPQAADPDAVRHCVSIETAEQKIGAEYWRCHSTCLDDARTESAALACDDRCVAPYPKLDCDALVRAPEVGESLGGTATLVPGAFARDTFCGRTFMVNDQAVTLQVAVHRTMRGLYLFTEEAPPPNAEVETATNLGDRAVRLGTVLPDGTHECAVKVAQRRVGLSVRMMLVKSGCPFDRLESLARTIAQRLP